MQFSLARGRFSQERGLSASPCTMGWIAARPGRGQGNGGGSGPLPSGCAEGVDSKRGVGPFRPLGPLGFLGLIKYHASPPRFPVRRTPLLLTTPFAGPDTAPAPIPAATGPGPGYGPGGLSGLLPCACLLSNPSWKLKLGKCYHR